MSKENEIKALFSLLESEPARQEQLTQSLAKFYQEDPKQVYTLALTYYGKLPLFIENLFNKTKVGNLQKEIDKILKLKNPSLLEILILLAKIINPEAKIRELLEPLILAREDFDSLIDSSFDINHKAQILKTFFFEIKHFKVDKAYIKTEFLNLPDIFNKQQTTPLVMAVIYLIFISPYEVRADLIEAENKLIVRLRDSFSLEPVYIDILNKGDFVSEEECDIYAAGNFIQWSSKTLIPLTNKEIFKRLIKALSLTSKKYNFLSLYFDK